MVKVAAALREYVEYIPRGEFNYVHYIRQQHKSMGRLWDIFEYVCQIPYLRAITGPVGLVLSIPLFVIWLGVECIKETLAGW